MKKLVYAVGLLMVLGACQVRHDHSRKMQSVRVAVDTAQRKYVDEDRALSEAEQVEDDGLVVLPEAKESGNLGGTPMTNADDEIERMMKGEDTSE